MKVSFCVTLLFVVLLTSIVSIDMSLATDGFVGYRSNTGIYSTNSVKVRYWNNTAFGGNGSWGNQVELVSAGSPIRNIMLRQSPVNSKMVMVSQGDDGNISAYVCMRDCNESSSWNYTLNISNVGVSAQRRFDIAFETATGDLLLVYSIVDGAAANDIAYKVLPENTVSFTGLATSYINDPNHNTQYGWIALDSDPVSSSQEILLVGFDATNTDINAWVWNGNAFGNYQPIAELAASTGGYEALAVKYAIDGSKGMVAGGNGTGGNISSYYWNSTAWTYVSIFDSDNYFSGTNDVRWITLKADPASDDLQMTIVDSANALGTAYWNGAAPWILTPRIDTATDISTRRPADFSWLPSGGTGELVWDSDGGAAASLLNVTTCNPQCTGARYTFPRYEGTGAWLTLYRNPTSTDIVKFLGLRLNSLFDIHSLRYNGTGLNYTNYGVSQGFNLTQDTTVSLYEAYSFDFRRDVRPPNMTINSPDTSVTLQSKTEVYYNITANEYLYTATLEWNGTNYTMNISTNVTWYYNVTDLAEGTYNYIVYIFDLAGNVNFTEKKNITIDFPPNVTIVNPPNNTLNNYSRNTTFYYNVTDSFDDVSSCSLIVDGIFVINTTSSPVSETTTQNFTYAVGNGQHNWSIWCNDTRNMNATSEVRNITGYIAPIFYSIYMDDELIPANQIVLSAGSTRFVNCSIVVGDPDGPDYINNVTAKLHYYLNKSIDPDDNTVHYTNSNCTVTNTTSINRTFSCGFNVLYYANNGSWICNLTVNNYPGTAYFNTSNTILPLYAVNLTDGIEFFNVSAGFPSENITANITNFGNMPVNITIQGYAIDVGDREGMNCSDNTNITITNIRFSTNSTANFFQKTQMNGSTQPLRLQIRKQINSTVVSNVTYWQVNPDPGSIGRICDGHIIFNAEAP